AGALGPLMEREQYARSLTAPLYQGSRLVGILELQDRIDGAPFGAEDVRRVEPLTDRISKVLAQFDGTEVTAPEPIPEEDREALFLPVQSRPTDFPNPPDLFSEVGARQTPETIATSTLAREGPSGLTRRELIVFKGFTNALLVSPNIDAVVFSLWSRERGELYVGARRPLSAVAQAMLLRNLEAALRSAVPEVPV